MASFDFSTTAEEVSRALAENIRGKTILITGATPGGLGAEAARAIALSSPSLLVLAGRNLGKLRETASQINAASPDVRIKLLQLDLNSQKQIRKAAEEVNSWDDIEKIDVLINNAGIMATEWGTTEEGIERQFGSNHIGHFLFTNLIMRRLLAAGNAGGARIINVTSDGHSMSPVRFDDYNFENGKAYDKWLAYGQSKAANILFTIALASKLRTKGVESFCLHPGMIWTNLGAHLDPSEFDALKKYFPYKFKPDGTIDTSWFKSLQQGAATHLVVAFDSSLDGHNGAYLEDCKVNMDAVAEHARGERDGERLWELSERLVGQKFEY